MPLITFNRRLTRQGKQNQPVDHQDWPEHWDIEDREPGTDEPNGDGSGCRVPELELGEAADKWPELLVLFRGETPSRAVLHLVVYELVARIELGLEEGEEKVQEVDP